MNNKRASWATRIQVWLPFLLASAVVIGMLIGLKMADDAPQFKLVKPGEVPSSNQRNEKIEELLRYIEARYVDSVDRDKLIDEAIDKLVSQLDPHSSYIPSSEIRKANEQLEGKFDGIGIEFLLVNDTVTVVHTMPDSPADDAGLKTGDQIIKIGTKMVSGKSLDNEAVVDHLRGGEGSKVQLAFLRGRDKKLRQLSLAREPIDVSTIDAAYMLNERVGYIRLARFSANSDKEFIAAMADLWEKQGMKDLVIDLRQNPGGYLQVAANILSQVFPNKGSLLVYTQGRASYRADYKSTGRSFYPVDQVVVLIDEGSASAAEIVAGAVQDNDRGQIIGRRSYGKGLVQEQYEFSDGSALRLTVARYYTPSGRSIQKPYGKGIDYDHDVAERIKSGELLSEKKIKLQDTTSYLTHNGRKVFAGGGIVPDVFVPVDSAFYSTFVQSQHEQMQVFAFRQLTNADREQWQKKGLLQFRKQYHVNADLLSAFQKYAHKEGAKSDATLWQNHQETLRRLLKAHLAQHLFHDEGYHAVLNDGDACIVQALKVVKPGMALK
jgi:carboxyl-terminal processing protease